MTLPGAGVRKGALLALVLASVAMPLTARAATTTVPAPATNPFYGSTLPAPVKPGEKMLVESDPVVYDYDHKTVSAVGHVRIYYGQYTLQADRVTYNEGTGSLVADGNVRLVDPLGNEFNSTHVDLTSNFRDAFVASLEVNTPQQTHFSAESAQRQNGNVVTFFNGSYTACEVCADHPERPPLWNVKAATIVVDQQTHTVSFTDARLEFFGQPVAWLPRLTIADPSIKRKTGFLWPSASYSARLGFSVKVPYYWAIAPSYDLTLSPALYTRQGLLGEAEWRQRLDNGQYSIDIAGIDQKNKSAFDPSSASYRDLRGGVRSMGAFDINRMWSYGWDATLLSDRTFTRDYRVLTGENSLLPSTAYLTGVGDRSFFQAYAASFQVLTEKSAAPASNPGKFDQGRQAVVIPVVDYRRVVMDSPHGGEVTLTSNFTSLTRSADDPFLVGGTPFYTGTAGTAVRASQELAWQRQAISADGQVVTPFAYLRGDSYLLNANTAAPSITTNSTAFRVTPAAGIEWSYPVLLASAGAAQIIEPKAQLIVRPNEMGIGSVPNNDAQSLVYEVANLFDRDKFSGWDRSEGGSRLNVGLHYNSTFVNGAAVDGTLGQSFQVLGQNSFAVADVADVGPTSGLETWRSDYVGAVTLDTGLGPSVAARGRFDEKTLAINRAELQATAALGPVTAAAAYFYLRQSPNSDLQISGPASVVHGAASINLSEYWRAFGSFAYDVAKSAIASNSLGLAFDNSCLTLAVTYSQTYRNYTDLTPDRVLNFRLELRTLGDASVNANLNALK
jgi:LPS-assembly protein